MEWTPGRLSKREGALPANSQDLVAALFEAGRGVGLTRKEVAQALVRSVRDRLRPGLKRQ